VSDAAPTVAPAPLAPGPARVERGIPQGFAHSEAGAVAAASAFVRTGQALLDMDPLAAADATTKMAAKATASAQARAITDQLAQVRDSLAKGSGPIAYWQAVLAARTVSYSDATAQVAVWNVGVLARAGIAPPQAGWAISTLTLVWERGDWRLQSESIAPGPAPIPNDSAPPATAEALTAALRDFRPAPK
jgi:hypothetical protein